MITSVNYHSCCDCFGPVVMMVVVMMTDNVDVLDGVVGLHGLPLFLLSSHIMVIFHRHFLLCRCLGATCRLLSDHYNYYLYYY